MFTDLVGEPIFQDDYYYSIWHGSVLCHRYAKEPHFDSTLLSSGRVVKDTKGMTHEKALAIFKERGIENT